MKCMTIRRRIKRRIYEETASTATLAVAGICAASVLTIEFYRALRETGYNTTVGEMVRGTRLQVRRRADRRDARPSAAQYLRGGNDGNKLRTVTRDW